MAKKNDENFSCHQFLKNLPNVRGTYDNIIFQIEVNSLLRELEKQLETPKVSKGTGQGGKIDTKGGSSSKSSQKKRTRKRKKRKIKKRKRKRKTSKSIFLQYKEKRRPKKGKKNKGNRKKRNKTKQKTKPRFRFRSQSMVNDYDSNDLLREAFKNKNR